MPYGTFSMAISLLLFRYNAGGPTGPKEHLATRVRLPHARLIALNAHKARLVILTPETAGSVDV